MEPQYKCLYFPTNVDLLRPCALCRFGWVYENKCDVRLNDILMELPATREPVFYDAYLQVCGRAAWP